jgi:hypothetical protein
MTRYMRRKALITAYGAHVADWRTWRWRRWCAASAARASERSRWRREEYRERLARNEDWREAIAELRANLEKRG